MGLRLNGKDEHASREYKGVSIMVSVGTDINEADPILFYEFQGNSLQVCSMKPIGEDQNSNKGE